jgi:Ser/Thr protein kinase RdoA (MazF antagonist)
LGAVVARIHALDRDRIEAVVGPLPSPVAFPWLALDPVLDELLAADQAVLRPHWRDLARWKAELARHPHVVCHGDVHPGNVLVGAAHWVLLDWDTICWAPPAFDHAPLLTWGSRWGGPPDAYTRFARGYGADWSADPFTQLLAAARNFAATVMLCRRALGDPTRAEEAARRVRFWAGEPDAPMWTAQ